MVGIRKLARSSFSSGNVRRHLPPAKLFARSAVDTALRIYHRQYIRHEMCFGINLVQ